MTVLNIIQNFRNFLAEFIILIIISVVVVVIVVVVVVVVVLSGIHAVEQAD